MFARLRVGWCSDRTRECARPAGNGCCLSGFVEKNVYAYVRSEAAPRNNDGRSWRALWRSHAQSGRSEGTNSNGSENRARENQCAGKLPQKRKFRIHSVPCLHYLREGISFRRSFHLRQSQEYV